VATFVLVHGAWHAAWHWHLVWDELAARGHTVVTMDLPSEDRQAGATRYAEVVTGALRDAGAVGEPLVLVGHSLGGLTVPVVATMVPVHRMVFIAALLPTPGRSYDEVLAGERDRLRADLGEGQIGGGDGSSRWRPEAAVEFLYPDAPPELAALAAARLRPQYWRITQEVTPLTEWPDVKSDVIACAQDRVVNPDWVRRDAHHLGVEAAVLPGDHSPFLSRPAELCDLLDAVVGA
jgi:pimeloyl-ACP methyl ester carboxylesterase